jgi:uncharacterized protein YaiL (DUF2058 family)
MQNLREKLLSAGLVTAAQTAQVEVSEKKELQNNRGRRSKTESPFAAGDGSPMDSALHPAIKAIEEHRIRGDVRGTEEFNFEDRKNVVRKMFVTKEIAHGLTAGRMAIVENGDQKRHVIVGSNAISKIRSVDPLMIRFFNNDGIAS